MPNHVKRNNTEWSIVTKWAEIATTKLLADEAKTINTAQDSRCRWKKAQHKSVLNIKLTKANNNITKLNNNNSAEKMDFIVTGCWQL